MSALLRSLWSPSTVACTRFTEVVEPSALVSTSFMPASSRTALTPPPAITPVPSEAGLRSTEELSNLPVTSCGMVVLRIGTSNMLRLARSWPFWMAAGTVLAFPRPVPTLPLPSPTTTRAEKLKRRPPLTTLATRRISTTLSWRSEAPSRCRPPRPPPCLLSLLGRPKILPPRKLDLQSALARPLGERRDASVVLVWAPVEDDRLYPGLGGSVRDQGSDLAGGVLAVLGRLDLAGVGRRERPCCVVVNELGVDVHVRAVHGEAGSCGRACHLAPDALAPLLPVHPLLENSHKNPPTNRPCRPCAGSARRCSGCPCPCTARADGPSGSPPPSVPHAACLYRAR